MQTALIVLAVILVAWGLAVTRIRRLSKWFERKVHARYRMKATFVWIRCECGRLWLNRDMAAREGCYCGGTGGWVARPGTVMEAIRMTVRLLWK